MVALPSENMEQREYSSIAGWSANLYNYYGIKMRVSQKIENQLYIKTQFYHSWTHTQRMFHPTTRPLHQLYSVRLYY